MKNNNNTKSTIAVTCAAIKHFYEMNDVYLRWKKLVTTTIKISNSLTIFYDDYFCHIFE
ncbi:MAG: hypothetical protein ACPKPY_00105 [Nitrososphaeraceae archaeon]